MINNNLVQSAIHTISLRSVRSDRLRNFLPQFPPLPVANQMLFGANQLMTSGETLCRDNCQLISMPYFHTRSAGKNNRNLSGLLDSRDICAKNHIQGGKWLSALS